MKDQNRAPGDLILSLAAFCAVLSFLILPVVLLWRIAIGFGCFLTTAQCRYFDLGDFLGFLRHQQVVAGQDEPLFALGHQIFGAHDLVQAILTMDMLAVALILALALLIVAALLLDAVPG